MRILAWHVHGSWMTAFVQGDHEYLIPVVPDRGPDGRGRAETWDWPAGAREVTPEQLREEEIDVVLLQRPHEIDLTTEWTGRRPGVDLPAVYVEHNAPPEHAARTVHPLADRDDILLVHVTRFNEVMWDNGIAPTTVVEHGIVDPGHRWTGEIASLAVVVNEPVRRWRVAGTDLVERMSRQVPVDVYGMGMSELTQRMPHLSGRTHENLRQEALHTALGRHRAYFHPYRWTSLGLSLIEAMTVGLPVLCLAVTEAPDAVPAEAGLVSNDLSSLAAAARRWMADPEEAERVGRRARRYALGRYGLSRSLGDWDALLKEVRDANSHDLGARQPTGRSR